MTITLRAREVCPQCTGEFDWDSYDSVNVSVDPGLKSALLDGSLLRRRCPTCACTFRSTRGVLYHDMDLGLQVSLRPDGQLPGPAMDKLAEVMLAGPVGKGYRLRWVETVDALAEKVRVIEQGLDDRIVELVKVWLLGQEGHLEDDLAFLRVDASEGPLEFLTSDGRRPRVPRAIYDRVQEQFATKLAPDTGWLHVDRAFALRVLGVKLGGPPRSSARGTDQYGAVRQESPKRRDPDGVVTGLAMFGGFAGVVAWVFCGSAQGVAVAGAWLVVVLLLAWRLHKQ